ncbi:hypothetical protein [Paenibacillus segetis]|uniref:hypothetical protein n=1 Tax=Paenibacillus segetis TaxID=1325360 RepID=UPI001889A4C3|nr:hypothetical protein [Paenibacillus segetis]
MSNSRRRQLLITPCSRFGGQAASVQQELGAIRRSSFSSREAELAGHIQLPNRIAAALRA